MAEPLSDNQIEAIVWQQVQLAKTSFSDKGGRKEARDKAINYYFANMDKYVPPEENRSKVVSRDVADTIGWMLPQIMRIFTASGRMFVVLPDINEDDEQFQAVLAGGDSKAMAQYMDDLVEEAERRTHAINDVFWKENDGYSVVRDASWDALLHADAIVKTYWDDTPVYGPARFTEGLTEDQLALHAGDESVDVLAQTKRTEPRLDPMTGQPVDTPVYDIKSRKKKADGRVCVEVIPNEEFLIDSDATNLKDAAFKAHWQRKTRSELIQMGYSKEDVWGVPEAVRNATPEEQARRAFVTAQATDKSMQLVDYFECYPQIDVDGDGVAEMLRVCIAGGQNGKMLAWEVWEDEDPFDNIPCSPVPHRWNGESISDKTLDIQDVKTVLKRQFLNNIYWINNPQPVVTGPGLASPEGLVDGTFGQPIFAKAGTTITPLEREYIGDKALAGIQYMDEESAKRTGVTAQTMALDPETLQNQSATANQNATDASRSQPELIARDMAEYGWVKVGRKLMRLLVKHKAPPRAVMVKGKPAMVDPSQWNPEANMTINTGLGTGSRDRDAMMLGQVLQQQILYTDRIGQVFPEKALDMLPFIHNTLTRFAEATGLKNPELYWPDLDADEIEKGKQVLAQRQQQPPESIQLEQMKGQVQSALKDKDVEAQLAIEQGKQATQQQLNELENQRQTNTEAAQLQADLATKEADRRNAIDLEIIKQQGLAALKQMDIDSQERMHMATLAHQASLEASRQESARDLAAMKPDKAN